jgi:hypothetical protein
MTNTEATTEIVDITITQMKYLVIIGTAAELGGMISDISKLNIITERRMVISREAHLQSRRYAQPETYAESTFLHCRVLTEIQEWSDS